jgi:16S rRNA (guanine1207-N2)-methyltransferase
LAHPKADPGALVARWLRPLTGRRILVVDVPDLESAHRLDPARGGEFSWFCTHWPTHQALLAGGIPSRFGAWSPGAEAGEGDHEAALVFLPRGRDRIRMTLAMAASLLPAGSPLWVVGAKGEGIESAERDLEQVAIPQGVETGKHARLLMSCTLPPVAARLEDYREVWPLGLGGETLQVVSLPGVFSHGRLDDGTRLLLETVPSLPGPLLDVGCGAGILGAWYAARGAGAVTLVDADALALESARRTLVLNGLSGRVEHGDVFPSHATDPHATAPDPAPFASIVSNPPFHQGSATDDRVTATLVAGAGARLRPGGTLTLVCNRFLPIPDRLDRAFGSHVVLADDARYRVYQATRR